MESFYAFGFVALIAALFKIIILYQSVTDSKLSSALNLLIISFILQNCFEFLAYLTWVSNPEFSAYLVSGVFISYFAVAAAVVYLITRLSQTRFGNLIASLFGVWALVLTVLLSQGLIASAYVQTGYTITASEGRFYPLFSLFVIAAVLVTLAILGSGSFSQDRKVRDRCRVTLIAIMPICLVSFSVVLLSSMGFDASSALVTPIASTLFVWVLMIDQRGDYLRFKIKWVILLKLAINAKDISLNNWSTLLEKMLVLEAMRISKNNKTEAAKLLGVNKTTFHRKSVKYCNNDSTPDTEWQQDRPVYVTGSRDTA